MPAIRWLCPRCFNSQYSAYDNREKAEVECLACGWVFDNPYYRMNEDGLAQGSALPHGGNG